MAFSRIRLPEPPSDVRNVPDIFDQGLNRDVIQRAIIIGNGAAGAENQCIGLVRALGFENYTLKRVARPRGLVHTLLRWLPLSVHKTVDQIWRQNIAWVPLLGRPLLTSGGRPHRSERSPRSSPGYAPEAIAEDIAEKAVIERVERGPLLVVASGRDTVETAALIRELAPDASFVIQIQHPRCDLNKFDLVIAPRHDFPSPEEAAARQVLPDALQSLLPPRQKPGDNVIQTVGSLHVADAQRLREAAVSWRGQLGRLPKPIVAVFIGGPTGHCKYGSNLAYDLALALKVVASAGASVRVTFSRRTPSYVSQVIVRELQGVERAWIWDGRGGNPYLGMLAWADAFIITADSISMTSEACSTGKPVYVMGRELCTGKFKDFHSHLERARCARPFTGTENMQDTWSYPPLNDTVDAAQKVKLALAAKGWQIK